MFCTINNLLCRHFREEQKNLDKQNWNKIGVLQKKLKKWERLPFQGIKLIILVVFIRVGWGGKKQAVVSCKTINKLSNASIIELHIALGGILFITLRNVVAGCVHRMHKVYRAHVLSVQNLHVECWASKRRFNLP